MLSAKDFLTSAGFDLRPVVSPEFASSYWNKWCAKDLVRIEDISRAGDTFVFSGQVASNDPTTRRNAYATVGIDEKYDYNLNVIRTHVKMKAAMCAVAGVGQFCSVQRVQINGVMLSAVFFLCPECETELQVRNLLDKGVDSSTIYWVVFRNIFNLANLHSNGLAGLSAAVDCSRLRRPRNSNMMLELVTGNITELRDGSDGTFSEGWVMRDIELALSFARGVFEKGRGAEAVCDANLVAVCNVIADLENARLVTSEVDTKWFSKLVDKYRDGIEEAESHLIGYSAWSTVAGVNNWDIPDQLIAMYGELDKEIGSGLTDSDAIRVIKNSSIVEIVKAMEQYQRKALELCSDNTITIKILWGKATKFVVELAKGLERNEDKRMNDWIRSIIASTARLRNINEERLIAQQVNEVIDEWLTKLDELVSFDVLDKVFPNGWNNVELQGSILRMVKEIYAGGSIHCRGLHMVAIADLVFGTVVEKVSAKKKSEFGIFGDGDEDFLRHAESAYVNGMGGAGVDRLSPNKMFASEDEMQGISDKE